MPMKFALLMASFLCLSSEADSNLNQKLHDLIGPVSSTLSAAHAKLEPFAKKSPMVAQTLKLFGKCNHLITKANGAIVWADWLARLGSSENRQKAMEKADQIRAILAEAKANKVILSSATRERLRSVFGTHDLEAILEELRMPGDPPPPTETEEKKA